MTRDMQHHGERRASGVRRVPVERIVDVCPTSSASGAGFQGWSVNVSGRGMSVRATHLPELEAPLVMRFQEHGAEVIAEAVVVWRKPADAGSEFGVRFTALDSRSVQALKALCQAEPSPEAGGADDRPGDDEADEEYDTEPAPPAMASALSSLPPSARSVTPSPSPSSVKLHIEGLAAPMQARLRQLGSRQVALASPLEFLRVGRNVDVEESALGPRRRGRIDRVDVDVDPDSQVPELVVSLRYDATSPPPRVRTARPPAAKGRASFEPEVEDGSLDDADAEPGSDGAAYGERESPALKATVRSVTAGRPRLDESELDAADLRRDGPSLEIDVDTDREGLSDAERLRQRLDGVLDELSKTARVARQRARHVGAAATRGARWLVARAESARRSALAAQRALPPRRTASAPRSLRAVALRSQTPSAGDAPPRRLPPRRALTVGAIVLGAAAATWIGRASPRADAAAAPPTPAAVAPAATAAPGAPAPVIIEEMATPPSQRPRVLVPADDGEPDDVAEPAGVVAQVPLFGPTSLDPAPVRGARSSTTRAAPERRALARAQSNAGAFEAPATSSRSKAKASPEFTSGRLHLPTVYRLRLDEPGASMRGERTPTGFDVIIPGRKTMESGTAIARRDSRIAKVSTRNGSDGARVSFRFRSDIPAYKVRLRNDFVEFFISD
jgi:PilZ domain-containing protein